MTAPTTGPTQGLAFFQDRNAPSTGTDSFVGGSAQNITGAIYFPDNAVTFTGNSSAGGSQCTQLIALKVNFNGTSNLSNNCAGDGTTPFGNATATLVE